MAGHSHSSNIAIRKGANDKKRGALFGKLSRAIIIAARHGGGDPLMNLKLRYAIDKARQNSMPKDNIERAIKKGCGELDGEELSEIVYEGYGPAGVAVMCDILTENRNRTAGEVRKIFEVHGGNLGATNCVGWMFERKGLFLVPAENVDEDRLMEVALEAGADDVAAAGKTFEVTCDPVRFEQVQQALKDAHLPTDAAEICRISKNTVELGEVDARRVLTLINVLEEHEDVQSVTANYSIPDELLVAISASLE
ncbi:MAG: YebC/PmpR family DNA-binding transcriptional regulator [Planctomycetaceae bacterium]|nr:YebC/PmpR family DNA-binding transcriptional regulator [Planctomycetaceae bacterium]